MKTLPDNVTPCKRTPEFTESSIPAGLLKAHSTKKGTWGEIVVLEGSLVYRILEPALEELVIDKTCPGIIEPTVLHEVAAAGAVRFYVQFHSLGTEKQDT